MSILYEFDVLKSVRTVKITTTFDTPNTSGDTRYAQQWEHTSIHDTASMRRGSLTLCR